MLSTYISLLLGLSHSRLAWISTLYSGVVQVMSWTHVATCRIFWPGPACSVEIFIASIGRLVCRRLSLFLRWCLRCSHAVTYCTRHGLSSLMCSCLANVAVQDLDYRIPPSHGPFNPFSGEQVKKSETAYVPHALTLSYPWCRPEGSSYVSLPPSPAVFLHLSLLLYYEGGRQRRCVKV